MSVEITESRPSPSPRAAPPRLRVATERSHYLESHRRSLTDILKAQWSDRTPEQKLQVHGPWYDRFEVLDDPLEADIVLLPMRWNYYVDHGRVSQACRLAEQARSAGKPLVIFSLGDWTATLPRQLHDAHLWQTSAYRSRTLPNERAMPPLFADLLSEPFSKSSALATCEQTDRAKVAFCGQAGGSPATFLARRLRVLGRKLRYRLRLEKWEPMPFETTALRARAVGALERSDLVDHDFLIRDRYFLADRQEDSTPEGPSKRQEFLDNLQSSPYALCIRGSGNFSLRFYEALCLGRLPLLLDTDCLLPFEDSIPWQRICINVPMDDFRKDESVLAEALAAFHRGLEPGELVDRQKLARRIWLDYLSWDGFYDRLSLTYASG